jgi:hypothetical protein
MQKKTKHPLQKYSHWLKIFLKKKEKEGNSFKHRCVSTGPFLRNLTALWDDSGNCLWLHAKGLQSETVMKQ